MGGGASTSGKSGSTTDDVKRLFKKYDADGNGRLDKKEFTVIAKALNPNLKSSTVKAIFKDIDIDNNGFVDIDEFLQWVFHDGNLLKKAAAASHDEVEKEVKMNDFGDLGGAKRSRGTIYVD
mmetsp:Transcript_91803/g.163388  ORF Transcript_91803/g.163388 Transcript_91803/m.163388 type:complete len:122 (+) Transcript_91803:48-413(+)